MTQRTLSLRDTIKAASLAGYIGAATGTVLFTGYFTLIGSAGILLLTPLIFLIGAAVTVTWTILIALPGLWIARSIAPRYPIANALMVAVLLYAAGHFLFTNLIFWPADSGIAGKSLVPLFGLPTAIALPFSLMRARHAI